MISYTILYKIYESIAINKIYVYNKTDMYLQFISDMNESLKGYEIISQWTFFAIWASILKNIKEKKQSRNFFKSKKLFFGLIAMHKFV